MVNEELLKYIKGEERKKYAKKYGISALINMYHGLPWNDVESEKIYKICNSKGITWEEYYKISEEVLF